MDKDKAILFTRKQWEEGRPFINFTKEELDKAKNNKDGFIGFGHGCVCYLWRYIKE